MAVYVNDAIWRRLSEYYNVTPREAQVGDLYKRWLDEKGLNWYNAGDYFMSQFPGVLNRGDAEWLFWTGGFGDDLVLLLDPAQEPQTGTAPQWALNRADTRVPSARHGTAGGAELRGVYHGLLLPGAVGNYAELTGTNHGSVDVRVRVQMFSVSTIQDIASKFGASGSFGWVLRVLANGNIQCLVSETGTDFGRFINAAHGFAVGDSGWLRFTYDGSTGRMELFKSDDSDVEPDVWTSLNSGVVAKGNIYATSTPVRFGLNGNNINPFHGAIKRGVVRPFTNGVTGAPSVDVDFTKATPFASSFTATTGGTVTITAASGVDSNDPTFLQHAGTNYLHMPSSGNYVSVADNRNATTATKWEVLIRGKWNAAVGYQAAFDRSSNGGVLFSWIFDYASVNRPRVFWMNGSSVQKNSDYMGSTGLATGVLQWFRLVIDASGADTVVTIYTAADSVAIPTVWTTHSTATVGGSTGLTFPNVNARIGDLAYTVGFPWNADVYRVIEQIDSVTTVDADFTTGITNGNQTSFTATTGQTVTINRSASGKKAVAVTRPCWLFGTNSYMTIVDNDLLDFGANDSFTVIGLSRNWDTFGANVVARKRTITSDLQGWALRYNSTRNAAAFLDDNPTAYNILGPTIASGALGVSALVVDRQAGTGTVFLNGVAGTPTSLGVFSSLANTESFEVGRNHTGTSYVYSDMELFAVAVVRRALTVTELEYVQERFTVTPTLPLPKVVTTGATTTTSDGYTIHTWTTSGSMQVIDSARGGSTLDVEYLVVAGGGGGAGEVGGGGGAGGGGAGGLLTNVGGALRTLTPQTFTITVGAGAAGGATGRNSGANGSNSSALGFTATGGGGGAAVFTNGGNGGSGGGAAWFGSSPGTGTSGQGNGGGSAANPAAGGGGGAGAVGGNAQGNDGGSGGNGQQINITGVATYYGGGGGGGRGNAGTPAAGGLGGGGEGGQFTNNASDRNGKNGVDGLGGGGGGGHADSKGGDGGDGIVIIRYPTASVRQQ